GAGQTALRLANQKILDRIGGEKGTGLSVTNVTSNLADVKPALKIDVNPQQAILHGTTTAQVALPIQALLNGQSVGIVTLVGQDASNAGAVGKPLNLFVQVDPASVSLE